MHIEREQLDSSNTNEGIIFLRHVQFMFPSQKYSTLDELIFTNAPLIKF